MYKPGPFRNIWSTVKKLCFITHTDKVLWWYTRPGYVYKMSFRDIQAKFIYFELNQKI